MTAHVLEYLAGAPGRAISPRLESGPERLARGAACQNTDLVS
jgi:hypothetical protein